MTGEIAIVGAGYVGVPLAQVFADAGRQVVLVEIDGGRVERLNRGESYIEDVPSEALKKHVDEGRLEATTDYDRLREADAILINRVDELPPAEIDGLIALVHEHYPGTPTLRVSARTTRPR